MFNYQLKRWSCNSNWKPGMMTYYCAAISRDNWNVINFTL